jgi:isomaltose glucohydrolase
VSPRRELPPSLMFGANFVTPTSDVPAGPAALTADPALVAASLHLIRTHQHASGAYPASPTFSAYRGYCWFRDGAFVAEGMRRAGDLDSAANFHRWCADVLLKRTDQVESLVARAAAREHVPVIEMLPTRFRVDGSDGSDPWWDFQLDGYGAWLWALANQIRTHGLPTSDVVVAARLAVRYLCAFWDRPCYDWWEEHQQHRHVSTLGAIRGGLASALGSPEIAAVLGSEAQDGAVRAVAGIDAVVASTGTVDGHLVKWLGSSEVDASLLACLIPFELDLPAAVRRGTLDAVEEQLSVHGGVHRYLQDTFYGGGQWLLLSGFMAWNHLVAGNPAAAASYLHWIEAQATAAGELPEQVGHHRLAPERVDEWVERWGPVATPLLWSHGMYLIVAAELQATGQQGAT